MFNRIARGVKGFTLIELLAVMAIVAVLAGIISVAVAGSGETSRDTQTVQDGTTIETAVGEYFGDQSGTASVETSAYSSPFTNGVTATQTTSSLWPENFITTTYAQEFPSTNAIVNGITIFEKDGTTEVSLKTLLDENTAVSFTKLETANVLTTTPDSSSSTDTITLTNNKDFVFHNFLWLLEEDKAAGSTGTVDSRNVVIYKLLTVAKTGTDPDKVDLTFLRIF